MIADSAFDIHKQLDSFEKVIMYNRAMLYRPHPGAQKNCYYSPKPINIVVGGNDAGKTYMGMHMLAQFALEAPFDTGYSMYPFVPHPDVPDDIDVKKTIKLREKVHPVKMPAVCWLSEYSREQLQKIIFGITEEGIKFDKNKLYFPDIIAGHVEESQDSDMKGVWKYCILDSGSSIHFLTTKAGWGAYTGEAVDFVYLDEPHDWKYYTECVARVTKGRKRGGAKLLYTLTPIVDLDKPETWDAIMSLKTMMDRMKHPVQGAKMRQAVDVFEMPLAENLSFTAEQIDIARAMIAGSGMSQAEQEIRLTGKILLEHGVHFFDIEMLRELRKRTKPPIEDVWLEDVA